MTSRPNQQDIRLGHAVIYPNTPAIAGAYATITLTYTADHPIDDTGYIKICFRQVGDFGAPQFADPAAPNYCTVKTSGNCRVTPRWDRKGHTRPWGASLFVQVGRGYLGAGETITVTFGDKVAGSPGWQLQTFAEDSFEFKVLVDPIATYEFKELPTSPTLKIIPGSAARTLCVAPSQVSINSPFTYYIKHEDRWGNPTGPAEKIIHPGFAMSGIQRIAIADQLSGNNVLSNPIQVGQPAQPIRRFWADFHGQTEETVGTNAIGDYFRFGRDLGLLDVVAHQGNDFQVTDEFWAEVNDTAKQWYTPGQLVTYPGYEWSGNTPLGGDRNIYFVAEGGPISHSSTDLLPNKSTCFPISPTATDLFRDLRQSPVQAFAFAHVGGRFADISMHDPAIEVAVEIHSAWGTFEWLLEDALRMGYRIGVVANSDGHKCRPGASYPGAGEFGSLGGLTCLLTDRLDRESIYAALRDRHCYATTGNRPLLSVMLTTPTGQSAMMGDVVATDGVPVLRVAVSGTAPVESVLVRNGLQTLANLRPYGAKDLGRRIKVVWSGAEVRGRARITRWDGELTVTGNQIVAATPINFWNANWPLVRDGEHRLAWRSSTTGGLAGAIVELADVRGGNLKIKTAQGEMAIDVDQIGLDPAVAAFGGLDKQIEIHRMADGTAARSDWELSLPLTSLTPGDNPVFVRVTQEDGHMAWSSPIYVVGGAGRI